MEDIKTILTNDNLIDITGVLKDSRNEDITLMDQIEADTENFDNSKLPLEEGEASYIADGVLMSEEIDFDDLEGIDESQLEKLDKAVDEVIAENLKSVIGETYDLSDEEAIKFISLLDKVRKNKNNPSFEKINLYPELPEIIQEQIKTAAIQNNIPVVDRNAYYKFAADLLIDELINNAELDALTIDLEKAMKEITAPMEMYSEFNKDYIENEFVRVAEEIREENPKTADNLLEMRRGFIHAYTYENMYELLNNAKIVKNIRRAEVMWSRTNTEYLRLANICKFKLYALNDIHSALMKLGYSDIQAKRIATLFVYTYTYGVEDYKDEEIYNDIYRNSFANYFEVNVNNLAIAPDLQSDFSKEIKGNLDILCKNIDGIIAAKDAELSNEKE